LYANTKTDPKVEDVYVSAEHIGLDMGRVNGAHSASLLYRTF